MPVAEPIRAVAYLRCSSDRQAQQDASIPAQRREIENAAGRDGAHILQWFEDEGISGKSLDDRPGANDLLNFVDDHGDEVDRFYVYDFRRMARNREEAYYIRRELKKAGVQIVALTQPGVDDEASNALLESVYDGIAEMERLHQRRMARRGMEQAIRDGWWPHNKAPYGYSIIGSVNQNGTQRFKLVLDPNQADTVRRVFELYLGGLGFQALAGRLTQDGVPAPSRPDKKKGRIKGWRSKHVRAIITDVRYTGVATWDDEVVCEDHHPAIIDADTFQRAQALRASRRRNRSQASRIPLGDKGDFTPWLRCGNCGGSMVVNRGGQPGKRIHYYTCGTRVQSKTACIGLTVRVDELDPILYASIEREVLEPARVRRLIDSTLAQMREGGEGEIAAQRAQLESRILETQEKINNVTRAVGEGLMTPDDVRAVMAEYRAMKETAEDELDALPQPQPIPEASEELYQQFRQAILDRWHQEELAVRRRSLERIIEEVVLKPGEATIRYSWKPEPGNYTYHPPYGPP